MKHPHAELMALYAQDATQTSEPYLFWQVQKQGKGEWYNLTQHPTWSVNDKYRPRKILWDRHAFLRPITTEEARALGLGATCYVVDLTASVFNHSKLCKKITWTGSIRDYNLVKRNIVHLTEASATGHALALLGETSKQLELPDEL